MQRLAGLPPGAGHGAVAALGAHHLAQLAGLRLLTRTAPPRPRPACSPAPRCCTRCSPCSGATSPRRPPQRGTPTARMTLSPLHTASHDSEAHPMREPWQARSPSHSSLPVKMPLSSPRGSSAREGGTRTLDCLAVFMNWHDWGPAQRTEQSSVRHSMCEPWQLCLPVQPMLQRVALQAIRESSQERSNLHWKPSQESRLPHTHGVPGRQRSACTAGASRSAKTRGRIPMCATGRAVRCGGAVLRCHACQRGQG